MKPEGFSSFEFLLSYLYQLQRLGIKTGLEHSRKLLEVCGRPDKDLRIIHIAGTNGKGSVSANIANILRSEGLKTGLYTSPHLIRFNERIRINGIPITDEEIIEFVRIYRSDIDRIEATFFETTTAMALWYFQQKNVDVCVVETGLGGRLDSTNVINPDLTVITPVDMDHAEYLGNTIEKIAGEKAGIIKKDVPLILARQRPEAESVILDRAKTMNAKVINVFPDEITNVYSGMNGTNFRLGNEEFKSGLIGAHQASNAALAVKAVRTYLPTISEKSIKQGLLNVVWPGRLQLLQSEPPVFYDVAHNPHGIEAVSETLGSIGIKKVVGLIALKGDKNVDNIAEALKGKFHKLFSTYELNNDLIDAAVLAEELNRRGIKCQPLMQIDKDIEQFINAVSDCDGGLIFGSHYIGKAIYKLFDFSFDKGHI